MGALEADAEAYVRGVRRGGVLVFATGSSEKADVAADIMNRHHAVEIEKLSASEQSLPSTAWDETHPVRIDPSRPEDLGRLVAELASLCGSALRVLGATQ